MGVFNFCTRLLTYVEPQLQLTLLPQLRSYLIPRYFTRQILNDKSDLFQANTAQDAEEGLLFMQEMVELSKMQTQQAETRPQAVTFTMPTYPKHEVTLLAGPAHFGRELKGPSNKVTGKVVYADPLTACTDLVNADKLAGKIVIMDRGDCMFVEKVSHAAKKTDILTQKCLLLLSGRKSIIIASSVVLIPTEITREKLQGVVLGGPSQHLSAKYHVTMR